MVVAREEQDQAAAAVSGYQFLPPSLVLFDSSALDHGSFLAVLQVEWRNYNLDPVQILPLAWRGWKLEKLLPTGLLPTRFGVPVDPTTIVMTSPQVLPLEEVLFVDCLRWLLPTAVLVLLVPNLVLTALRG